MENWRPVVGHEGEYEVSDLGRVRSLERKARAGRGERVVPARILKPGKMNKYGHCSVAIGKGNSRCVHDLVLEAFVGPRPPGQEARHLNLDGGDNKLSNLTYGTKSQNGKDVTANGRRRVTYAQADEIRARRAAGESNKSLAEAFNMSKSNVSYITTGKYYVA